MISHDRQVKRIVVYRVGSLGDTLVVLPAFHLVRRVFPDAHITLLTNLSVNAKAAPMESILQHTGLYDDTLKYPASARHVRELWKLWKQLRAGNYDCLVYLAKPKGGILSSIRDHVYFRSCGIRRLIGVPFSRRTRECLPLAGTGLFTSETMRTMNAIQELGAVDVRDPQWWDLRLTEAEIAEAAKILRENGIMTPFLAASVGTKMYANDWEDRNWMELIRRLAAEYPGLPLVLFGVAEEWERSERLMVLWRGPKANLCGVTSPRVSAAVLRNAALMICHDSGPMHLAATVAVPCVAIFSALNPPGVWYPQGDSHHIIYPRNPCMECDVTMCKKHSDACILSIPVEEVHAAARSRLQRSGIHSELKPPGQQAYRGAGTITDDPLLPSNIMNTRLKTGLIPVLAGGEVRPQQPSANLTVLLIGNYVPDAQESMQRFAFILEKELAKAGVDVRIFRPEPFFGRLRTGMGGLGKWLAYLDKFLIFPIILRKKLSDLNSHPKTKLVVHICDHSNAMYVASARGIPVITTCHDLLAVRGALGEDTDCPASFAGKRLQRWILRGLSRASIVACDSSATKADADRMLPEGTRTCMIPIGLNHPYRPIPSAEVANRLSHIEGLQKGFILHVGSNLRRKNREGVLRIFAKVAPQWAGRLVFAGQGLSPELRELAASLGISDRITEVRKPDNEMLEGLYNGATALLFPSRFEGFGWPIIEAQACGCPVICSRSGPMPEVAGEAGLLREVDDENGFATDILRLTDPGERERWGQKSLANAQRFTIERMVQDYLRIYAEAIEACGSASKSGKGQDS
jgi:ADP-heptose:LPS heptosyltransferase/glycosyltransferase involved in cell wall biosynthesis